MLKWVFLLAALAVLIAVLAWPRLNDVETGHTPDYPDLQPREYSLPEGTVASAAQAAIAVIPRWRLIGSGHGPGGSEVHAEALTRLGFRDDVTVRIRSEGARTRVTVRSRSRVGRWDFGQNARNIQAFLNEMDRRLGSGQPISPPRRRAH